MNAFINLFNEKRYLTQNNYLRNRFGNKTVKLCLNAGIGCPNRDGTKSKNGCTYCSSLLSGDFSGCSQSSISEQLLQQKNLMSGKWKDCLYIAYFQTGSNTYAPLCVLKKLYEEALSFPGVVGISIATRADCISKETAKYLSELSEKTYLTVELGLQTIHDCTAVKINRCHTYGEFIETYNILKNLGIKTGIHIINGLPGEDYEMMMQTAAEVGRLHPHSLKIHMLHIMKGTAMADEYMTAPFKIMNMDEYISIICDQIELMPQDIIIERVTGDGNRNTMIAPMWTTNKKAVMNGIDKELKRRNSYQGIKNINGCS